MLFPSYTNDCECKILPDKNSYLFLEWTVDAEKEKKKGIVIVTWESLAFKLQICLL